MVGFIYCYLFNTSANNDIMAQINLILFLIRTIMRTHLLKYLQIGAGADLEIYVHSCHEESLLNIAKIRFILYLLKNVISKMVAFH